MVSTRMQRNPAQSFKYNNEHHSHGALVVKAMNDLTTATEKAKENGGKIVKTEESMNFPIKIRSLPFFPNIHKPKQASPPPGFTTLGAIFL